MHVLFVHPNYPAQFRFVAPRLASDFGWQCTFATSNAKKGDLPGVAKVVYRVRDGSAPGSHPCTRDFQNQVGHAYFAYEALKDRPDVKPDLVVAHSGFGSSLFLPHLYDAPVINFFEYFRRPVGGCIGYRPEHALDEHDVLACTTSNAMILLDLHHCDRGWCPNVSQRDAMPKEYHPKIEVMPEGVDTRLYRDKGLRAGGAATGDSASGPERRLPDGTVIPPGTRIVTYVSRGFELARGFDVFMSAAKRICEARADVLFLVAGTDKPYYMPDRKVTGALSLRQRVMEAGNFDPARFRFLGWLSEENLVDVLSLSDLHVYLTVPFVTSWSMVDAMSCGCVVLASDQECTREYIQHGRNGLLCDFFDAEGMAKQGLDVLDDPAAYRGLGNAARATVEKEYSLGICLPRIKRLFEEVAAAPRSPSVRTEGLVRPAMPAWWNVPKPAADGPAEPLGELPPFDGTIPFNTASLGESIEDPHPNPLPEYREREKRVGAAPKTVLFCWELGAGLGHLMQMLPLAEELARAGHCVVVALRHLEKAVSIFGRAGVFYLHAPHSAGTPRHSGSRRFAGPAAFGQFLANIGFGDDDALFAHACAWRNLFRSVAPDLIVCDHSPTALLAARAFPDVPRAVIGSGFCVPPDDAMVAANTERAATNEGSKAMALKPWAPLRPAAIAADPAPALAVEGEVLSRANWVLEGWGYPPMERLGQLSSDVAETFLTTFPEIDHFGQRQRARYWGPALRPATTCDGEAPQWPQGNGKRIFAYLKPTPATYDVLRALKRSGCPTLVFIDGIGGATRQRLRSANLHFANRRVDIARASRECDLAVLNGGHGVTVEMLLAGKPVLAVPLVLEQQMTGQALARLRVGESAPVRRGEPWDWTGVDKLEALLTDDHYAAAARQFAERYAAFDPDVQRRAMLTRAEELLAGDAHSQHAPAPADPPEALAV